MRTKENFGNAQKLNMPPPEQQQKVDPYQKNRKDRAKTKNKFKIEIEVDSAAKAFESKILMEKLNPNISKRKEREE